MFSMLTLSSPLIQSNDQIDPIGLCTLYLFTICHAKTAADGSHASHAFIILIILFELMKKGVPMLPMLSHAV